MKKLAIMLSITARAVCVFASGERRAFDGALTFDFDWKFAKFGRFAECLAPNDPGASAAEADYNDGSWRSLDLPHDFGVESEFLAEEPNQTASLAWNAVGWYRKRWTPDAADRGKKFYLDFDGVMMLPQVYVNGKLAGEWKYGYSSFRVDITPHLVFGKANVIAVRCENLGNSTRWYPGAGIYRHVWLVKTEPVHFAYNGVFVEVPEIGTITQKGKSRYASTAKVKISAAIEGDAYGCKVRHIVVPPKAKKGDELVMKNGECVLKNVRLWDVDEPARYVVLSEIVGANGKVMDKRKTFFGVRKSEWKGDGYYLNGRRLQIKGVCQHHDLGPLGSAVHTRAIMRQIEILKSFGVNSIRTSHNPPAPELLDLCDKMGIVVDAELFDCWKYVKEGKQNGYNRFWDEWREKDVANFVMRDRNHPCVIAWSAGNEIEEQGASDGPAIARELVSLIRKYDPTRQVTCGCNDIRASWNGFGKEFDVYGFNYKPNDYTGYANKNNGAPFVASETSSCVSSRGFYSFPENDDWPAFWRRNFCDNLAICQVSDYGLYAPGWAYAPDVEFAALEDEPRCAGEYVWTGFDYLGEPTPWNLGRKPANDARGASAAELERLNKEFAEVCKKGTPSRSSYFGIVDLCGFWKDRAYLYQSHWMPDKPMAHILPHWNWQGQREGKITPVMVYTSGDSAELFLNGKSLGRRDKKSKAGLSGKDMNGDLRERFRLVWDQVRYEPGTLRVVAYKGGKKWAEDTVETTGPAKSFVATADRKQLEADGRDLSFVSVVAQDAKGRMMPTATDDFTFTVEGAGELVGVCNGDPTDRRSMKGDKMRLFAGKALAVVRSKRGQKGAIALRISSPTLGSQTVKLRAD